MSGQELWGAEHATPLSPPYWEALRDGRFVLQLCADCGRFQHYPRRVCRWCGGPDHLEWAEASGTGAIFAAAGHHRSSRPVLADRLPLLVALVRWDEGPASLALVEGLRAEVSDNGSGLQGRRVRIEHDRTLVQGLLTVVEETR